MYHLLLNQTYLYLLQHPEFKINKSKISKEVGLTRQTVSKELQEITNLDNELGIKDFHNDISNKYERALAIISDIDKSTYTVTQMSAMLGVSTKTLCKYYQVSKEIPLSEGVGVYGIFHNDDCIYIGYSSNIIDRFKQHKFLIDNQSSEMYLYQYCAEQNFTSQDLRFVILCQSFDVSAMKKLEQNLCNNLKPPGNILGKF